MIINDLASVRVFEVMDSAMYPGLFRGDTLIAEAKPARIQDIPDKSGVIVVYGDGYRVVKPLGEYRRTLEQEAGSIPMQVFRILAFQKWEQSPVRRLLARRHDRKILRQIFRSARRSRSKHETRTSCTREG